VIRHAAMRDISLCRRIRAWGAPLLFLKILRCVLSGIAAGSFSVTPLDFVEFFAGQQAVSNAMKDAALVAAVFELKLDPIGQNMLSDLGFANAVNLCLNLKPGAGCLMAPVCSTWTFMNRGTSKRSLACPYGNAAVQSVQEGNTMVARCVLLLLLLASRGCWWVLEQPQGSLMQEHPALQHLMSVMTVYRHCIQMCHYGASSKKRTWLYSNARWICDVDLYKTCIQPRCPTQLVTTSINKAGKVTTTGNADLKASQHYPVGFGRAICNIYMDHCGQLKETAGAVMNMDIKWLNSVPSEPWQEANLKPVLQFMRGSCQGARKMAGHIGWRGC